MNGHQFGEFECGYLGYLFNYLSPNPTIESFNKQRRF